MATRVAVAVLGDRNHPFETWGTSMPEEDFARPYAAREKAELDVENDELLVDVLGRGATELGIDGPHWSDDPRDGIVFVSFYVPEDEDRYERSLYRHFGTSTLTLVDDRGRVRWNVPFKEERVTYGEVLRASEAGVLGGDPRRPYLILAPGVGNGIPLNWQDLVITILVIREVMGAMADAGGALAFGRQIMQTARDRIGGAKEPVEEHLVGWTQRGALPFDFTELLGRGPWHSGDLAERLDCTEQEAEAILWAFGYTVDSVGLWRRGGDEPAELLSRAIEDVLTGPAISEQHRLPIIVEERLRILLDTGAPPPEPEYEPHEMFEFEVEDSAIRRFARRVGAWLLDR